MSWRAHAIVKACEQILAGARATTAPETGAQGCRACTAALTGNSQSAHPVATGCRGSRDQRGPADLRRLPVVPLGFRERLIDLREWVLVRDETLEGKTSLVANEEIERARNHRGVVHDDAYDLLGTPDERRRLQLDLGPAADRADLEIGAAGPQHL